MASFSQEEENFVRMSLLLTGIFPRAVRTLFDNALDPICLDATLKREFNKLKDLQKKRVINQSQWNLLTPRFPDVPDSKKFDVTLMILLLRNLTSLNPPNGGYDNLPTSLETTPAADLARIKYYRNFLAHLVDDKIDSTEFSKAWEDITAAIGRLGGQLMKQECDNWRTRTLDHTNQEIMLDIKHSNDEIMELKQSVESLKKYSEDTVPWNVRAQINMILEDWKKNEQMFKNTRAARHVLKCIKENSCVTITASSGVGKTAILRHVALQMTNEGFDILLVTDPGDIVKFYNPNKKTLFVIDDLCGNYSFNQTDLRRWEPVIERFKEILKEQVAKVIVACRLQVYQDDKFESLSLFKSCVCNLLSENLCLSKTEKQVIAEFYLKTKAHEITDFHDLYDCFPLICKLYHDNPTIDIRHFFHNPFSVYEAEMNKLQKKGYFAKYGALALCIMFNNRLKEGFLTEETDEKTRTIIENTCEACRLERGTSRIILKDELDSLIDTFIKKKANVYKAIHDKIFDFLTFYFGHKIIMCLIKNAHSGLIKERFLLEREDKVDQFITIVPPDYHQMYIERMIEDWSEGIVNDVFCNINMKTPQFRQRFLSHVNQLDISYQRQLAYTCDVNKKYTVLLLCCIYDDIPMIQWCFNHGIDINQCGSDDTSTVSVAAKNGHTQIVKMLLDRGGDYNKCNKIGVSPVMYACDRGHTEIVKILVDRGIDYDRCNKNGDSLVTLAFHKGHTEIVKMLLDRGVDFNKCNKHGDSLVELACSRGHTEIVKMLLDRGVDFNKCNKHGDSLVELACSRGHTEIVKMLLDKGVDFNKCNKHGDSLVMLACVSGHTEIVKMLLDRGVVYDKCNSNFDSLVRLSRDRGHTEIVTILLDREEDIKK